MPGLEKVNAKRGLIVVDERQTRRLLAAILSRLGCEVLEPAGVVDAMPSEGSPDVVFFYAQGTSPRVERFLKDVVDRLWPIPVIVVSDCAEPASIVRAIRRGAVDYLVHSSGKAELEEAVAGALSRLHHVVGHERCSTCSSKSACTEQRAIVARKASGIEAGADAKRLPGPFIAESPGMRSIEKTVHQIGGSNVTVLITGETGTGKEVVARHIHHSSGRSDGPFIKVNCAALPERLLESELFGYEKGAFTGAESQKRGKFEVARGGVILLDEISERPASCSSTTTPRAGRWRSRCSAASAIAWTSPRTDRKRFGSSRIGATTWS